MTNMVATVNLGMEQDLKELALRARNAEYNPKRSVPYIKTHTITPLRASMRRAPPSDLLLAATALGLRGKKPIDARSRLAPQVPGCDYAHHGSQVRGACLPHGQDGRHRCVPRGDRACRKRCLWTCRVNEGPCRDVSILHTVDTSACLSMRYQHGAAPCPIT
jgi:hypothetical protein